MTSCSMIWPSSNPVQDRDQQRLRQVPLQQGKKDPSQHVIDTCTRFTQAWIVKDLTTRSVL
eukprot:679662-Prorocentrum_lima.AAC.1